MVTVITIKQSNSLGGRRILGALGFDLGGLNPLTWPMKIAMELMARERSKYGVDPFLGFKGMNNDQAIRDNHYISHGGGGSGSKGQIYPEGRSSSGKDRHERRKFGIITPIYGKNSGDDEDDPEKQKFNEAANESEEMLQRVARINIGLQALRNQLAGQDQLLALVPTNIVANSDTTTMSLMLDVQRVSSGLEIMRTSLSDRLTTQLPRLSERFDTFLQGLIFQVTLIQSTLTSLNGQISIYEQRYGFNLDQRMRLLFTTHIDGLDDWTKAAPQIASSSSANGYVIHPTLNQFISELASSKGSVASNMEQLRILGADPFTPRMTIPAHPF